MSLIEKVIGFFFHFVQLHEVPEFLWSQISRLRHQTFILKFPQKLFFSLRVATHIEWVILGTSAQHWIRMYILNGLSCKWPWNISTSLGVSPTVYSVIVLYQYHDSQLHTQPFSKKNHVELFIHNNDTYIYTGIPTWIHQSFSCFVNRQK